MATVVPFPGLRYASRLVPRLSKLVTPPYDIISPHDQERFYQLAPENIIRLEYGRVNPGDSDTQNRYTRARVVLGDWLSRGVLGVDAQPAFYVLQTQFVDPLGKQRTFTGVMCRVKLEPLGEGSILPHERTFQGPKTDRLNLLETTGVSFSPVFSLYRDTPDGCSAWLKKITRRTPWADFKDWSGNRQKLWVVNAPADVKFFQSRMRAKKLLIADGHHRYSTALNYRERQKKRVPEDDYVMMCLADTADPGLTVLPVYRLVRGVSENQWRGLRAGLEADFELESVATVSQLAERRRAAEEKSSLPVLGCLGGLGRGAYLLKVKARRPERLTAKDFPQASSAYRELDVVMLDQLILNRQLGIVPGEEADRVRYTKDPAEAAALVARGEFQAAFLPGPPKLEQIWAVAKNRETMPQKSTYFLPKLITGLVMNPIRLPEKSR
jgi:uncharacterized protein (DUF1015 family)